MPRERAGDATSDDADTEVFRRVAYYVGPHQGRVEAIAAQPMLRTVLGAVRGGTVLMEARPTVSDRRYWVVASIAPLFALAVLAVPLLASSAESARLAMHAEVIGAKVLAFAGCVAGALAFGRSDYMRRAWTLMAADKFLIASRGAALFAIGSFENSWPDGIVVLLANACGVAGMWLLARVAAVAGFRLPGSRATRWAVLGGCVVLSLGISAASFALDVADVQAGRAPALQLLASGPSSLGDAIVFCLIAPLFLTSLAMRGGVLRWPWGLLALGQVCWLLYDATWSLGQAGGAPSTAMQVPSQLFRVLACALEASAGLTYWLITRPAAGAGT